MRVISDTTRARHVTHGHMAGAFTRELRDKRGGPSPAGGRGPEI